MANKIDLFSGDPDRLGEVAIDAPLSTARLPCCAYYDTAYKNAALQAQTDGDPQTAATYRFLSILSNFAPSYDTPQEPYVPLVVLNGKRTFVPSDLSSNDVEALRKLAALTDDPALRARLLDLVWVLAKDHAACAEAAKQYLDAADRLNTDAGWTYAERLYYRGVYLAGKLGRSRDLYLMACDRLIAAARTAITSESGARYGLMKLLLRFHCGDPQEFARAAVCLAGAAEGKNDSYYARLYWEVAADSFKWAGRAEDERNARLSAAETYITEAQIKGEGPSGSGIAGAHFLQKGIEAMRRARAEPERIEALKKQLAAYQAASLNEMQTFRTDIDISGEVRAARRRVAGLGLQDAIFRLALAHPLENLDNLKRDVQERAGETPLLHMMGANQLDSNGRTTSIREGLWSDDGDAREKALEDLALDSARFSWHYRALGYIEPAREQILNDHNPTIEDLAFLVRDNPFVPPGHESIYLRGLHAGFHGDFLVAAHLIVPQIENSIRYVLESAGVDVSNLMSDGTQPVKVLGPLFAVPRLEEILGRDTCFELRGHLIEKSGFDYRNRLSHGFVTEEECYSAAAVSTWWLVLRLCTVPLYNITNVRPQATTEEQAAT